MSNPKKVNDILNINDVLDGLRCCLAQRKNRCIKCPYCNVYRGFRTCVENIMIDALAALEAQEEKEKETK